jgi:hypothetical protein
MLTYINNQKNKNMKILSGFVIVLALVAMYAFTSNVESKVEKSQEPTFEVYAIHDLEIKPGVDLKEFETFVMKEIAPIYNKMEGQKLVLVKGDRGLRTSKYAILLTFDSLEDRNRIYPPSGGLVGDFGSDALWDKFSSMLSNRMGETHTDYVKVSHE